MPRIGLTRERVVAEAAVLVDELGSEQFTLAVVAKRLGVSLPGLYKHIDGIDQLKRDLAMLGVRELTATMSAAAVGRRTSMHCTRPRGPTATTAHAHPGMSAVSVRTPDPGDAEHDVAMDGAIGVLGAVLADYELMGDDMVHAIHSLRVVLHGLVTQEAAGGLGLPQSVGRSTRPSPV
ncbi:MAG: TetR/AcrR family transcriptional regulator [Mycobacteriaceae bacterium]